MLMAGAACSRDEPTPAVEREPPVDAAVTTLERIEADGRWLVLNYWAQWCKPCLEEIPELNAFAAERADSVRVVLVNFDGVTGRALGDQISDLDIRTDTIETDPGKQLGIDRPQALPSTYIFDPALRLTHTLLGPQTRETLGSLVGNQTTATGQ